VRSASPAVPDGRSTTAATSAVARTREPCRSAARTPTATPRADRGALAGAVDGSASADAAASAPATACAESVSKVRECSSTRAPCRVPRLVSYSPPRRRADARQEAVSSRRAARPSTTRRVRVMHPSIAAARTVTTTKRSGPGFDRASPPDSKDGRNAGAVDDDLLQRSSSAAHGSGSCSSSTRSCPRCRWLRAPPTRAHFRGARARCSGTQADISVCRRCAGALRIVEVAHRPASDRRVLNKLGLAPRPRRPPCSSHPGSSCSPATEGSRPHHRRRSCRLAHRGPRVVASAM